MWHYGDNRTRQARIAARKESHMPNIDTICISFGNWIAAFPVVYAMAAIAAVAASASAAAAAAVAGGTERRAEGMETQLVPWLRP